MIGNEGWRVMRSAAIAHDAPALVSTRIDRSRYPVTSGSGTSRCSAARYSKPPSSGASQNNHNCITAQPPTNRAGLVLRAGLTEVVRERTKDGVACRQAGMRDHERPAFILLTSSERSIGHAANCSSH